jgi:predicted nucleic-acid-binding Zn-ribbon protein
MLKCPKCGKALVIDGYVLVAATQDFTYNSNNEIEYGEVENINIDDNPNVDKPYYIRSISCQHCGFFNNSFDDISVEDIEDKKELFEVLSEKFPEFKN